MAAGNDDQARDELIRLNQILRAVRNVNHLITQVKNDRELLNGACRNLTETRGFILSWAVLLDSDRRLLLSAQSGMKNFSEFEEQLQQARFPECIKMVLDTRRPVVIKAKSNACKGCQASRLASPGSNVILAPVEYNRQIMGLLAALADAGTVINDEETDLFYELARDVGFALNNIQMEKERKAAETALQESEKKYRSLVNNIHIGVSRSTPEIEGRFVEVNRAMEEITGYSRAELLGMDIRRLFVHPEGRAKFIRNFRAFPLKSHREIEVRKKDGSEVIVSISVTPVADETGNLLYIDGIMEDITQRKQKEAVLQELYEKEKSQRKELQEEARNRGLFINVLAHELRTPLTPILASTGMLREIISKGQDEIQKRLVSNIDISAQTLARRLEELLDLARYSRGTFALNREAVNLHEFFSEVLARFKPTIDERRQTLSTSLAENLPEAVIDPSRMEQVIINLLSNASKFSSAGDEIVFKAAVDDNGLLVEVTDSGIGISAEEQARLFQPYHRVEQDRQKFPGIGLGLAVSRQIIEAHGGTIRVTSQRGRGSTFHFRIPLT